MGVWGWVKGKLMPLSRRAWDPALCFSVYSRHILLTVDKTWESEVKRSYLAPRASQGFLVRFKHSGHSHPRREEAKILCYLSRQGDNE